ncbi:E3 ubiquitin-protein ligase TRIM71-like [Mytilus trossulus]|uniref:E3 ubiquitin-protein ligase TRIM71-like n=1 Tax=Mytilus trossulus TaxID=6551 RepID=UPI00300475BE
MAQAASTTCDICSSASTEHYCIDCEQYFCDTCKGLHKRQRATQNHEFQSSSDLIQAVKSKCKEHDEDFIFLCSSCDVPVCKRCMAGKHNGHKVANIDDSVTKLTQSITRAFANKLQVAAQNLNQLEIGLMSFPLDVNSVIKVIGVEAQNMKVSIDRVVQNMIDDINRKSKQEREKLNKLVKEAKIGLENKTLLGEKKTELEKKRRDADLHQKLDTLNKEITMYQPVNIPELPTIRYTPKEISEQNLVSLFGEYSVRETYSVQQCSDLRYKDVVRTFEYIGDASD